MIDGLDIDEWLSDRSVKIERDDRRIIFTHFTGECSILALRSLDATSPTVVVCDQLKAFYTKYTGAMFGDYHIIIGADRPHSLCLEGDGIELPTLDEMKKQAACLGMNVEQNEQVFMAEAAWMFVYSAVAEQDVISRYDRDFRRRLTIKSLDAVLENWWNIVLEDKLE